MGQCLGVRKVNVSEDHSEGPVQWREERNYLIDNEFLENMSRGFQSKGR